MSFADTYQRVAAGHNVACPIESGGLLALADNECEHGRLAGDRSPSCGCWPSERMVSIRPSPGRPAFTLQEARKLMTPITTTIEEAQLPTVTADAPYGYKANGEPRKRPAPTAETLAKVHATRRSRRPAFTNAEARQLAPKPASAIALEVRQRMALLTAELQVLEAAAAALEAA